MTEAVNPEILTASPGRWFHFAQIGGTRKGAASGSSLFQAGLAVDVVSAGDAAGEMIQPAEFAPKHAVILHQAAGRERAKSHRAYAGMPGRESS